MTTKIFKKNHIFDIELSPDSPYFLPSDVPFIKPSLPPAPHNFQSNEPSILTFDKPKNKKRHKGRKRRQRNQAKGKKMVRNRKTNKPTYQPIHQSAINCHQSYSKKSISHSESYYSSKSSKKSNTSKSKKSSKSSKCNACCKHNPTKSPAITRPTTDSLTKKFPTKGSIIIKHEDSDKRKRTTTRRRRYYAGNKKENELVDTEEESEHVKNIKHVDGSNSNNVRKHKRRRKSTD